MGNFARRSLNFLSHFILTGPDLSCAAWSSNQLKYSLLIVQNSALRFYRAPKGSQLLKRPPTTGRPPGVTANTQITRTATTNQKGAASAQPWLLVDLSRKKKTSNSQLLWTQRKDCLKAILRDIF